MQGSDEELVERARAGDTRAFAELVNEHQRFAFNLALRALGDLSEAEDVAQEAFLRAWQGLPRFRGQSQFRTWLYRIVVNLCYNRLPRLRRDLAALPVDQAEELPSAEAPDPTHKLEAAELHGFVLRQVERLPESYRMMLFLRYRQDLPYEEIAAIMQVPLGTVKTGLFRAHAALRERLRELEKEAV